MLAMRGTLCNLRSDGPIASAGCFLYDADSAAGVPSYEVAVRDTFLEVVEAPTRPLQRTRSRSVPPRPFLSMPGHVSMSNLQNSGEGCSPLFVALDEDELIEAEEEFFPGEFDDGACIQLLASEGGLESDDRVEDTLGMLEVVRARALAQLCTDVQAFGFKMQALVDSMQNDLVVASDDAHTVLGTDNVESGRGTIEPEDSAALDDAREDHARLLARLGQFPQLQKSAWYYLAVECGVYVDQFFWIEDNDLDGDSWEGVCSTSV
jgi:hypothetical protein